MKPFSRFATVYELAKEKIDQNPIFVTIYYRNFWKNKTVIKICF